VYCRYTVLVGPKFLISIKRSDILRNKTSMFCEENIPNLHYYDSDPSGRCLRLGSAAARLLGMGVRISQLAWCPLWMLCRVQIPASSWPLVQRSPTECGVSECDREASKRRRPYPARGCCRVGKNIMTHTQHKIHNIKSHSNGVKLSFTPKFYIV